MAGVAGWQGGEWGLANFHESDDQCNEHAVSQHVEMCIDSD